MTKSTTAATFPSRTCVLDGPKSSIQSLNVSGEPGAQDDMGKKANGHHSTQSLNRQPMWNPMNGKYGRTTFVYKMEKNLGQPHLHQQQSQQVCVCAIIPP